MCYDLITIVVKSLFVCNCYIQGLSENQHVVREQPCINSVINK